MLTNDTPGSTIRYTLDGSEPTELNGQLYSAPLTLTQPTDKTGILVRARAFLAGWLPSGVKTHTYLLRQPPALTNVPALLFTAQKERAFYKPLRDVRNFRRHAISPRAAVAKCGWRRASKVTTKALGAGAPYEREVHMEYFFPASYYPRIASRFARTLDCV
jgi:hypothetical protein